MRGSSSVSEDGGNWSDNADDSLSLCTASFNGADDTMGESFELSLLFDCSVFSALDAYDALMFLFSSLISSSFTLSSESNSEIFTLWVSLSYNSGYPFMQSCIA